MAAVAPVLFPEMRRGGSDQADMVALMASSAAMSEAIPPSLVLITLGSVTGVSIASLFTGGLIPAVVLALVLAVLAYFRASPDAAPKARPNLRTIGRCFLVAFPALLLPFLIRTAVIEGIVTATEVSTLGNEPPALQGLQRMPTALRGFWRRSEVAQRYAALTGRDIDDLLGMRVLALFKLGIVFLQLHRQWVVACEQGSKRLSGSLFFRI